MGKNKAEDKTALVVTPEIKTVRFIRCPTCGEGEHEVSHLEPGADTRWYCNVPDCGYAFDLKVLDDLSILVRPRLERSIPTLVTLRCDEPFTIVVKGIALLNEGVEFDPMDDQFNEHQKYFYEEHTCPTNYLGVLDVVDKQGGNDPHGLFKYAGVEPWPDDFDEEEDCLDGLR